MKLTFWGAARTVTGSMHELTVNERRYLLDCGTYQGRRQEARERNGRLPFAAREVDAVLLSHAHIDHSGNLPTLTRNGYQGPIYTSPATADLCDPMLLDSAFLQEKDAAFLNKRAWRRKLLRADNGAAAVEPVYTVQDAERVLPLFRRVLLHMPDETGPGLMYETGDAGHMLGSTGMLLTLEENGRRLRLVFSGDVGRPGLPIIPDPEPCPPADFLILESTYGDRLHQPLEHVSERLARIIQRTAGRGGKIIAPAFAVGRTQQLVLMLHELTLQGRIPSIPIYVDSPLAFKTTEVFRKHLEAGDSEIAEHVRNGRDPFGFSRLHYIQDVNESKALNDLRGPFLVIAPSGMCEGGRILHHLRNNIEDRRNTILITGFQAENTLGRKILEKQQEVPIFGEPMRLRAEVVKLNELSGHADQRELLAWMTPAARHLKAVFLVHGEAGPQKALARAIRERHALEVVIPARGESFPLG
ncbi:MAG: MBL fold metallo-hydrolase [Acidobacteria bacterium]|nr:MBL fold metallo-hydrolase [Acidobacteriota bacterium]